MFYIDSHLYVLNDSELKTKIIKHIHESPSEKYTKKSFIYNKVNSHYYWPKIIDTIIKYIKNCHIYKKSKIYRKNKQNFFKLLSIPKRYWQNISINFIILLSVCSRFDRKFEYIIIIMNRLSKKKKFIPFDSLKINTIIQIFIE